MLFSECCFRCIFSVSVTNRYPVTILHGRSIAGTLFLLLHLLIETFFIHRETVLAADKFGKVERKTVGVEEFERLCAVEFLLSGSPHLVHGVVQHADTFVEGTQERVLLFLYDACYQLALCFKFRVCVAHFVNEHRHKFEQERLLLTEEGIGIAHRTAQYAAYNVSRLCVSGQLSVGNRETYCTYMVGYYTHCNVCFLLRTES